MAQEEELDVDLESKSIKMDVYAKNEEKSFDLEMQSIDTKELPERARYYQGLMDVDNLKSGEKYSTLKTSYVIFICITDIFNKGLGKYEFENLCVDNPEIKLNDRAYKYFFIAQNCDKFTDNEQKVLMELVLNNKASDSFSHKIIELVNSAKKNAQWRHKFMEYERQRTYDLELGEERGFKKGIKQGIEQGIEQGTLSKAIESATNLLKLKICTPEQIAQAIGLPLEKVLELQKNIH